jgi:G:T-mismatch repair DNA endonuclease (very short patch repair protein)
MSNEEQTIRVDKCEYCGRDLPLIIEDKWCQELCKYAHEVYEQGVFVVNLFNGALRKRVDPVRAKLHLTTFVEAPLSSKEYIESLIESQNNAELNERRVEKRKIVDKQPEYLKRLRETNERIEVHENRSKGQICRFERETDEEYLARCDLHKERHNTIAAVINASEGQLEYRKSLSDEERSQYRLKMKAVMNRDSVRKTLSVAAFTFCQNHPEVVERRRASLVTFYATHVIHNCFQDTTIELICHSVLEELQKEFLFEIKKSISFEKKYLVDRAIVFEDRIIYVECHGSYWHHHEARLKKTDDATVEHDLIREKEIAEKASLVVLWEEQLMKQRELCKQILREAIESKLRVYLNSDDYIV